MLSKKLACLTKAGARTTSEYSVLICHLQKHMQAFRQDPFYWFPPAFRPLSR